MSCLTEEQLFALLDGGVAPNRAEALSVHVAGCPTCKTLMVEFELLVDDLRAPIELDEEAHVQAVMRRLAEPREQPSQGWLPGVRRGFARAALGVSAVALVAGLLVFVHAHRLPTDAEQPFSARGTKPEPSLHRDVGTRIFAGERKLVALSDRATLASNAALSVAYTNIHPSAAYLLVFAVDAKGTVHWLYPAFSVAGEDPSSITLERTDRERLLPLSVVLDAPAQGDLRIVSIATEWPLRVSDIERRPPSELTLEALRLAFPDGSVGQLHVSLGVQ